MKKINSFIILCLAGALVFLACSRNHNMAQKTNAELYRLAVRDVFADEDEILPLVNISKDNPNVIWNGNKVLVSFMHKYPDSYPAGQEIQLKWGNVWCVSSLELQKWIKNNSENVSNWSLRLHQLMGLPEGKATTVTSIWIDSDLLYRPAYVTNKSSEMKNTLQKSGDDAFDSDYKKWFDSNIIWSYFDSAYPWTRLGYTYDWADNGKEYGLSEFLIFSGAECTIESTDTIEDFVEKLRAQGSN